MIHFLAVHLLPVLLNACETSNNTPTIPLTVLCSRKWILLVSLLKKHVSVQLSILCLLSFSFRLCHLLHQPTWGHLYSVQQQLLYLLLSISSVQSLSRVQLCDPMDCSTPGLPVPYQVPEFTQTQVHWVGDAIQPSHPLSSPSPPAFNLSQHQGLFKWVSSSHQVAKVVEFQLQHQSFQWTFRTEFL